MPATRLLLIADSKMLPALANGLREGGLFDVLTVALSDPKAAQAAAEKADAVAVFYGAPGASLPAALQTLSSRVRHRGRRIVAVLQREQAGQRDDCFRAGASDLLFMPMPKEQFVARLRESFELSWTQESGSPASVSVATRTATSKLDPATVSPAGVQSAAELPIKAGETVRLTWGPFQSWGLVVRGGPSAQIRFAGLAPDEEAQIHDWLKSGAKVLAAAAPTPPGGTAAVPATTPPAAGRAAPSIGPPPGFADRKPVRSQARSPVRVESASSTSGGNGGGGGASFQEAPAAAATPAAAAVPAGPVWPVPFAPGLCRTVALQFLKDKSAPADLPPGLAASAKKITNVLGSAERAALDLAPDSHFADALAARIALDAATSEGVKLYSHAPTVTVDAAAVAAVMKQADEAAARLQKEANTAVGQGEIESLQMVTAASAALGRELLNFRETSDRLRGRSSAPRPGTDALDPDLGLPGEGPHQAAAKTSTAPVPVRAELRDFHNLDGGPRRGKTIFMVIALAAFLAALSNALYFSLPHDKELSAGAAGKGVERINTSGPSALVTVSPEWLGRAEAALPQLVSVLREAEVKKAVLLLPNGNPAGVLDVATGKVSGLVRPEVVGPPR